VSPPKGVAVHEKEDGEHREVAEAVDGDELIHLARLDRCHARRIDERTENEGGEELERVDVDEDHEEQHRV